MTYLAINEILEELNAGFDAAEAHGMAAGMLSVESRCKAENWLNAVLATADNIPEADTNRLLELFEQVGADLHPSVESFEFDLFLPEDDESIAEQVEALRNWCQGYLLGVGYSQSSGDWPGEIGEIMRDIVELTKVDSGVEDEDDAYAFMEIREYLRAAVFTVRDYFLETKGNNSH